MRKTVITALFSLAVAAALTTAAWAQELVVGGQAVGIQVGTKGVLIAGLTQVETANGSKSPAQDAGLKKGDLIVELGGESIAKASELIDRVAELDGRPAELTVQREKKTLRVTSRNGIRRHGVPLRSS